MELKKDFRNFIRLDSFLFSSILALSFLGLLNLAGLYGFESLFFKKQAVFLAVGLALVFLNPFINYRVFKNYSLPSAVFFGVSVFLLLFTLQATPVRGVAAWLHLPFGISFETSEITKLALILFLARYFSSRTRLSYGPAILVSGFYAGLSAILVFLQPDFGSALILFLIWLGGISLAGLSRKQILIALNGLIILFLIISVFVLKPYQKSRITSFLTDLSGRGRESYNVLQSKIAIGSGGLFGLGFGRGSQAKFGILPEARSDFALAALVEQFGFAALSAVSFLYFVILNRLLNIFKKARDNFSKFFVFMFSIYFFSHVIISMGINLGILPVTGLPLPFISYGGSYFISLMAGFAILENIRRKN